MSETKDPFTGAKQTAKGVTASSAHGGGAFFRHKGLMNVIAKDPGTGREDAQNLEGARD
ncbi:hypothetical protein ACGYLO_10765 [Sulfitobacter sp. 1A13353]|uniref:hypothetical protein n=1 Tax=Sulfitobacter sp. 1A13353 TaxID=3368568 RepID=UPI003745252E